MHGTRRMRGDGARVEMLQTRLEEYSTYPSVIDAVNDCGVGKSTKGAG